MQNLYSLGDDMKTNKRLIQIPVFVTNDDGIIWYDVNDESTNVPNISNLLIEHINNIELRERTAKVVLLSQRDVLAYYLNKIALITAHYYEFNDRTKMIWCIPHDVSYNILEDTIQIYDVIPNEDKNGMCLAVNYAKAKYGIPYKRFTEKITHNYKSLLDWYNTFMQSYF